MKTKNLSNQQLFEYFAEHVRYEVQMLLNATSGILQQLKVPQGLQHMPIESYAIHLRNLITFLYPSSSRDTDVCAKDFFKREEAWEKIRPELSEVLVKAKIRADKEVGHLTTSRQSGTPKDKEWDVKNLTGELMPLFNLFCESADKVKLKSSIDELLTFHSRIKALPVK
ncbi:MAG: hypothetical protein Q8Q92_00520 [bacterium]|nr:hypothetical protein [bacterium]